MPRLPNPILKDSVPAYIGLGSNLHHPIQQIQQALHRLADLPHTQLHCHSSPYQSQPLGNLDQPDYINACAVLHTQLSPYQLLAQLQLIENQQGRQRTAEKWAARTLDLDLLLYIGFTSQTAQLTLPHPGLYTRHFVLYPLYECQPELILPNGQPLRTWLTTVSHDGLTRLNGVEALAGKP